GRAGVAAGGAVDVDLPAGGVAHSAPCLGPRGRTDGPIVGDISPARQTRFRSPGCERDRIRLWSRAYSSWKRPAEAASWPPRRGRGFLTSAASTRRAATPAIWNR